MSRVPREVNSDSDIVLALDTQESELEDVKKIKEAAKGVIIPSSGTVQTAGCSSVPGASSLHAKRNWESIDTENEVFVVSASEMEKEKLPVRDELDASVRPSKR
jgi:hypothetical protein